MGLGSRRDAPTPRQQSEPQRQSGHRASGDRSTSQGHRHRFVQDGEVPVVMVSNSPGGQQPALRASETRAQAGRAAATAADIGAERAARDRAERLLQQAQTHIRDLETKLAHAELARTEAVAAVKHEKAALATLRQQSVNEVARLNGLLADERAARAKADQKAERTAVAAATAVIQTGEVRVKRAYTKRKRYPLADLSDLTPMAYRAADPAPAAAAPVAAAAPLTAAPVTAAMDIVAPQIVVSVIAEDAAPVVLRRTRGPGLAKAEKPPKVKRVAEPKPVKWWVKPRAAK